MPKKMIGIRIKYNNQERTIIAQKNGKLFLDDCINPIGFENTKRDFICGWEDYEVLT